MDTIDLTAIRQARQAIPLARATNSFLALASQTNHTGVDANLLLQAMTIALAKVVVETAEPGEARNIGQQISNSLPALIDHFLRDPHRHFDTSPDTSPDSPPDTP